MNLPQNLNCIITCENQDEVDEFYVIFDLRESGNFRNYKDRRVTDSVSRESWCERKDFYTTSTWRHFDFLTFKEFKAKYMKEELPEKWIVKPLSRQFKVVNDWAMSKSGKDYKNYQWHTGVAYDQDGMYKSYSDPTITFEQFNRLVLNQNKMKLIGYKLKNDKYKEAALKIIGVSDFSSSKYSFADGSRSHELISEAGVLDLWFTPVYEEDKPLSKEYSLKSGYKLQIHKNGDVIFSDGKFTVQNLKDLFPYSLGIKKIYSFTIGGFSIEPIISNTVYKIGCQEVSTQNMVDIVKIHQELNN